MDIDLDRSHLSIRNDIVHCLLQKQSADKTSTADILRQVIDAAVEDMGEIERRLVYISLAKVAGAETC